MSSKFSFYSSIDGHKSRTMSRTKAAWRNAIHIHQEIVNELIAVCGGPLVASIDAIEQIKHRPLVGIAGIISIPLTFTWSVVTCPIAFVGTVLIMAATPVTFVLLSVNYNI